MRWNEKFRALVLLSLLILAFGVDAKYKNYGQILESPDYREALNLLDPEKMLANYHKEFAVYADDEAWSNTTCSRDLLIFSDAITKSATWALMMLDSSSKLQSGLLQGNLIDLGQYDECMAVHNKTPDHDIRGRHCMYSISVTLENVTIPINPTLSICVPASCSANDIELLFNTYITQIKQLINLDIKIASSTCSSIDNTVWDLEFTAWLTIFMGIVIILIACTVIEVSYGHLDDYGYRHHSIGILAAFSLRKSAASILNMDMKEGTLPAIHGIRFLSMAWIVLGHEYIMTLAGASVNTVDFLKWLSSWKSLYIFLAPFAVDTFFTISGFLMTYLFLKQMPKKKAFNVPMYYFHRYVRLTPALIALIVFTIVFVPKLGSGAQWDKLLSLIADGCRTNWWTSLLYVQNFVDAKHMCLGHLWYLSVDMQLFWLSPLILYPLYRTPKFGLIILTAMFCTSLVIPASIIGIRKLPLSSFTHSANPAITIDMFFDIYIIPYHRAAPWLVGIFLGYEIANNKRQLNQWTITAGWLIAIGSFAFCTFGTRSFMAPDYEYDAVWETFFSAVSRPIWGLGVCWIIYSCIKNHAGPLSNILSSRIFLPLSRLSYCVYLVHQVLQMINVAGLRTPTYFSDYYVWRSYFGTLIMSVMVAFVFSLLFESPVMVLEKLLLKRKRKSRSESQQGLKRNENK